MNTNDTFTPTKRDLRAVVQQCVLQYILQNAINHAKPLTGVEQGKAICAAFMKLRTMQGGK